MGKCEGYTDLDDEQGVGIILVLEALPMTGTASLSTFLDGKLKVQPSQQSLAKQLQSFGNPYDETRVSYNE